MRALILVAAIGVASAALAANTPTRFAVSGTSTLTPDAPAQRAAGFRMQAQLTPVRGPVLASNAQAGGRFVLVAWADSVATACYNDTIFRDDFDGDGL